MGRSHSREPLEVITALQLKVKTSEILINNKIQDSIIKNWNSNQKANHLDDILDDLNTSNNSNFEVTLRIPWQYKGNTNHMLIKGNIKFTETQNRIVLSIICNVIKPLIIFTFLGFITSFVFLTPFYLFPKVNLLIPAIAGVVIAGIYFGMFYFRIQRISDQFINDLKRKYL